MRIDINLAAANVQMIRSLYRSRYFMLHSMEYSTYFLATAKYFQLARHFKRIIAAWPIRSAEVMASISI